MFAPVADLDPTFLQCYDGLERIAASSNPPFCLLGDFLSFNFAYIFFRYGISFPGDNQRS
jgi:hypothetical protein